MFRNCSGCRPVLQYPMSSTGWLLSFSIELYVHHVTSNCVIMKNKGARLFSGTISSDEAGFKPYPIIDEDGCSLEPSLYDDVTYESSFTAGIRNPYPVRFRSSSGAVLLYCVTTLVPTTMDSTCPRPECAEHATDA
ncbi:hypothetical protein ANCCEY_03510 [Ancylostoma ceylanicum]|uniref:ZP domain-containing protein n=1 Tax=Ancylostoma ceylanicum TaxID=53326 RepID=A0A0D6MB27_9BILA|nr:hypothetical protein ANCCEY_03510 [Ancylostoma ceylanicum]